MAEETPVRRKSMLSGNQMFVKESFCRHGFGTSLTDEMVQLGRIAKDAILLVDIKYLRTHLTTMDGRRIKIVKNLHGQFGKGDKTGTDDLFVPVVKKHFIILDLLKKKDPKRLVKISCNQRIGFVNAPTGHLFVRYFSHGMISGLGQRHLSGFFREGPCLEKGRHPPKDGKHKPGRNKEQGWENFPLFRSMVILGVLDARKRGGYTMDRTILVTGCSTGIGRCVAINLHQRGYQVFATARKEADVAMLRKAGLKAHRLDLTDMASMEHSVAWVLAETGGTLYALFNNAAYGQPGAVEDLPVEALRAQFETNFFGTHALTRLILPIMRRQGYGRIIQNSSILGFVALKYRGAYNASKYALEGLSDTLRLELRGSNIHVSLIEPGPVVTRFRDNADAAFLRWIDGEKSLHNTVYETMRAQRRSGNPATFSVPPEAVLKRVVRILESSHPRARYPVTFPTYLFMVLKRVLSPTLLDGVLARFG